MIELRGSDVVLKAAEALRNTAQGAGEIKNYYYEAERVREVNDTLAVQGKETQDWINNADQFSYDIPLEGAPPDGPTTASGSFGQATIEAVYNRANKELWQPQRDYINENVTNKAAREYLLAHLDQQELQDRSELNRRWEIAADHEAMASLNRATDTIMNSNESWDVKVNRVQILVNQMVSAGRMWKDEGENYVSKIEQQAQYSFAYNGAMAMMKEARSADAGEAWLTENTPFWNNNPDARAAVLQSVRQEYRQWTIGQDEETSNGFQDLHIDAAITGHDDPELAIQKIDLALDALQQTPFHDTQNERMWEDRLLSLRDRYSRLLLDPDGKDALEDAQEDNEKLLAGQLTLAVRLGRMTPEEALMVLDERFANNDIGGDFVRSFSKDLEAEDDPYFDAGLDYINSKLKGDEEALLRAVADFRSAYQFQPNMTREDRLRLAMNIADPAALKATGDLLRNALLGLGVNDERIYTDLERNHSMIEEMRFYGVALLPDRRDALATQAQKELEFAKTVYPSLNLQTALPDYDGQWTGRPGMARFLDAQGRVYAFKVENQAFVLYGLNDDGTWAQIARPATEPKPGGGGVIPEVPGTGNDLLDADLRERQKELLTADQGLYQDLLDDVNALTGEDVKKLSMVDQMNFGTYYNELLNGTMTVEHAAALREILAKVE